MIDIRYGTLDDYPLLIEYDDFIGDRRLDLQAGALTVADARNAMAVGYARIIPSAFLGWPLLASLCVRPDFRRKGVADALIRQAVADARYPRLFTTTEIGNTAMRSLLAKSQATEIGYADRLNLDNARELLFRLK